MIDFKSNQGNRPVGSNKLPRRCVGARKAWHSEYYLRYIYDLPGIHEVHLYDSDHLELQFPSLFQVIRLTLLSIDQDELESRRLGYVAHWWHKIVPRHIPQGVIVHNNLSQVGCSLDKSIPSLAQHPSPSLPDLTPSTRAAVGLARTPQDIGCIVTRYSVSPFWNSWLTFSISIRLCTPSRRARNGDPYRDWSVQWFINGFLNPDGVVDWCQLITFLAYVQDEKEADTSCNLLSPHHIDFWRTLFGEKVDFCARKASSIIMVGIKWLPEDKPSTP